MSFINDPRLERERLTRELDSAREKLEADQRAMMERARDDETRLRAMAFAVQAWPNAMQRDAGTLAALAAEIHGFLMDSSKWNHIDKQANGDDHG